MHEQLEALRRHGCDQVQGFLYSQAVPASELDFGNMVQRRVAGG